MNSTVSIRLLAALLALAARPLHAADVNVLALTAGKAVLAVDGGKPRTVRVGETTPENIRLIKATSAEAVIEVDGRRRTLTLGQSISMSSARPGAQTATLTSDARGHFFTTALVNGVSLRFIVDTGASAVTISTADARRAGISYLSRGKVLMQTANGVASAYRVKFDTVRLDGISLNNVDGVVVEGNALGGVGLLGLSFLNRTHMRRDGETMTLTRRY